jgi:hypothetical protein
MKKFLKSAWNWFKIQIDKTDNWESLQNSRTRYENSKPIPPSQNTSGPKAWKTTKDGVTTNHLT